MANRNRLAWTEQVALNLLRIVAGFLFWQHGAQKLLPEGIQTQIGILNSGPVDFFSLMGLAGILEFVGGLLLVLGLFTRPVAFILAGEMAWAYFQSHAPNGVWPSLNRGELAALYSFLFLYIAARGGGVIGIDGILKLRKARKGPEGEEGPSFARCEGRGQGSSGTLARLKGVGVVWVKVKHLHTSSERKTQPFDDR